MGSLAHSMYIGGFPLWAINERGGKFKIHKRTRAHGSTVSNVGRGDGSGLKKRDSEDCKLLKAEIMDVILARQKEINDAPDKEARDKIIFVHNQENNTLDRLREKEQNECMDGEDGIKDIWNNYIRHWRPAKYYFDNGNEDSDKHKGFQKIWDDTKDCFWDSENNNYDRNTIITDSCPFSKREKHVCKLMKDEEKKNPGLFFSQDDIYIENPFSPTEPKVYHKVNSARIPAPFHDRIKFPNSDLFIGGTEPSENYPGCAWDSNVDCKEQFDELNLLNRIEEQTKRDKSRLAKINVETTEGRIEGNNLKDKIGSQTDLIKKLKGLKNFYFNVEDSDYCNLFEGDLPDYETVTSDDGYEYEVLKNPNNNNLITKLNKYIKQNYERNDGVFNPGAAKKGQGFNMSFKDWYHGIMPYYLPGSGNDKIAEVCTRRNKIVIDPLPDPYPTDPEEKRKITGQYGAKCYEEAIRKNT